MGVVETIDHEKFPKQSKYVGMETEVTFNYSQTNKLTGLIIRDDIESPNITMIMLEDGRCILTTECHYTLPSPDSIKKEMLVVKTLKATE